jgi:hypothetical protein
VFYAPFPVIAQEIEPQAIFRWVRLGDKSSTKGDPLRSIHDTLKNRVLHSLTTVLAEARYSSQPSSPSFISGAYVIADKNEHRMGPESLI